MSDSNYNPWLHRFAVFTALMALLPLTVGALTTTLDAGMAFPDWPTSDGYGMFAYPWLKSVGDKFVEHGHRLAGMLIGFVSITLVMVAWLKDKRVWGRRVAFGILLAVISQGLLGGGRVELNKRVLAMIHGNLAAWVFTLMVLYTLWTSRSWMTIRRDSENSIAFQRLHPVVLLTPFVVISQYTLGGFVRHLHTGYTEHLYMAFVASTFVLANAFILNRSGNQWLQRSARFLIGFVLLQFCLGIGSWAMTLGIQTIGFVPVQRSLAQTWIRTSHTLGGMCLFATSTIALSKYARLVWLERQAHPAKVDTGSMRVTGGVA